MPKYRCLMIGAGGMGGCWIRSFFATFPERMEITGLVDIREEALHSSGDFLGLSADQRFTSQEEAFSRTEADFCCIVTPPAFHEQSVMLAIEHGMDILSEKPIADTWEACVRICQSLIHI